MKRYKLDYVPIHTKSRLFKINDRKVYYKHIFLCKGDIINEDSFKAYYFSDCIYEYNIFTIKFGRIPVLYTKGVPEYVNKSILRKKDENLYKKTIKCINHLYTENNSADINRNKFEINNIDNNERNINDIDNNERNINDIDNNERNINNIDNNERNINNIDNNERNINNIDNNKRNMDNIDTQDVSEISKTKYESIKFNENFYTKNKIFDFKDIAVFEDNNQSEMLFCVESEIHGYTFYEGISECGLIVICGEYKFIKYKNNAIGIDLARNCCYIYENGIFKKDITLFKSVINLFIGIFEDLERLFILFSVYNREYFWKYLPKNKDLVCSLYRNTDLKDELSEFIGDFRDASAKSLSKIIIYFPELQENFIKIALETNNEYLIEDYIEYLKRNAIPTDKIGDILLEYNSFYLYLLCKPESTKYFEEWSDLIELEKIKIKVQRIKSGSEK
ncbi:hypothetical protein DMUE_1977 [Dictyocoela muelleri]|nr:hypothetical protein DMUE_1977 [Dictyocoela muelleri]